MHVRFPGNLGHVKYSHGNPSYPPKLPPLRNSRPYLGFINHQFPLRGSASVVPADSDSVVPADFVSVMPAVV